MLLTKIKNLLHPAPSPMVVIYTPGKDGGTSVTEAARAAGLECHHFHRLAPAAFKRQMRDAVENDHLPPAFISITAGLRRRQRHGVAEETPIEAVYVHATCNTLDRGLTGCDAGKMAGQ